MSCTACSRRFLQAWLDCISPGPVSIARQPRRSATTQIRQSRSYSSFQPLNPQSGPESFGAFPKDTLATRQISDERSKKDDPNDIAQRARRYKDEASTEASKLERRRHDPFSANSRGDPLRERRNGAVGGSFFRRAPTGPRESAVPRIKTRSTPKPGILAENLPLAERIEAASAGPGPASKTPNPKPSTKKPKSTDEPRPNEPEWRTQKRALGKKFGDEGWRPPRRLSPDAMDGVRWLHNQDPVKFSTAALANQFEISPEAVRRILKSKWQPTEVEEDDRRARWQRRGESIWAVKAASGIKPPKRWREKGITRSKTLSAVTVPFVEEEEERPASLSSRIL